MPFLMTKVNENATEVSCMKASTALEQRHAQDLHLLTKLRRKMPNQLMPLLDKLLLRKRAILETIVDPLKNISQSEHTRQRNLWNFMGNLMAGFIAYTW